ncbi:MAG: tetratricopeptide repeat-containing sensor histidine kinase, partial [Tannerella sp.]|nr:tetratricopeptide repeat-containing sensor histidine kinase [Tannerella sp.]
NQKYEVANVITNIEALYTKMKQYDKALAYGEKAIEIMADKPDSTLRESVLINHASALYHLHRYSEAEAIYHEALRIGKNNNVLSTQSAALTGLGVIYLEKKDYITSEKYHEEAAKIFEQSGDWHGKCLAVSNIAVCETYLKNYAKAYKLHLQALAIAEQHNYPELAHNRYGDIAHLELLLNQDVEKCEYYLAKADSIEAVLRNEEVVKATAELEVRYETEKKELQLAEQKAVISREKFVREALIGGLGLTAIVLVLLWRLLRLRNKRNRALAERNDALDEMNATKDRFFTIISHDLKNPAVAQRDAIQMLLQNADKWDANALSSYYYELLKSADDQVELLYNLLNWARVQTGRMEYRPDTFDFVHKLRSEYALADKMAQQKGVGFATDMPETAIVVGDANMLAAVVRNLLTNAVKFTPKGGSVTLTIAAIDNASSLRVSVADTGTGMDAGALQNLFRIDSHTSTLGTAGEQGTGLGLAVCKEFLEKHGSTLHVESEPGRGSTFWFELAAGE